MKIKDITEEDLLNLSKSFRGYTFKTIPRKGNIGARLEISIGEEKYHRFISIYDNLLDMAIACYSTARYNAGLKAGISVGREGLAIDLKELLKIE